METLRIRAAQLTDEPVIRQFIETLEDILCEPVTFQGLFKQNLDNPLVYYLLAEEQGDIVGFISCHVQCLLHHLSKVGEIQELFVRPDVRHQGVGRQLISAVITLAQEQKWVNLEVTTNKKRNDAIRFYEREQFVATHVKLVRPIS